MAEQTNSPLVHLRTNGMDLSIDSRVSYHRIDSGPFLVDDDCAAILVVRDKAGYGGFNDRMIDFRVDDHANPVEELGRILALRLKRPEE